MNQLQLELTRLIGKKDLSFGCVVKIVYPGLPERFETVITEKYGVKTITENYHTPNLQKNLITEIIGHPPTLSDLHRMIASLGIHFRQSEKTIVTMELRVRKSFGLRLFQGLARPRRIYSQGDYLTYPVLGTKLIGNLPKRN